MRKGKISIATTIGLIAAGKQIYDAYKFGEPYGIGVDHVIRSTTGICTPKMQEAMAEPTAFVWQDPLATWGPAVAGSLISKYVGGPKGLNVNAQLRGIPIFKL